MHGGAVLAVPVTAFRATVALRDAPGARLPLIDAALARVGVDSGYEWSSDIPRGVGLAGSSALVIAALRATGRAPEDPLELARLALSIERDDLGIPAGLQDRATQAFEQPVLVDGDGVQPLDPRGPLDFVVAWCDSAAGDSGEYHRGRTLPLEAVNDLARTARRAADAFSAGDADALAGLMGESARLRDDVAPLPPAHNELARRLRERGLSPNSTGSGGAVVAVLR